MFRRAALPVVLGLLVALACLGALAAPAFAADGDLRVDINSVDPSQYPELSLLVQVGGSRAAEVSADPRLFTVTVDDKQFKNAKAAATKSNRLPNATVLLIDQSGSMLQGDAWVSAANAARSFIQRMRPGDLVSIQAFNERHSVLQEFTGDQKALLASLDSIAVRKNAGTALYDSVVVGLDSFKRTKGELGARNLIVLSDGKDKNSTQWTLSDAVAKARTSGVQIYAVGLKSNDPDPAALMKLAKASNGVYVESPNPEGLVGLYDSLAREIQNQFTLTVTLQDNVQPGSSGEARVSVSLGETKAEDAGGFYYPATLPTSPSGKSQGAVNSSSVGAALARWAGADYLIPLLAFVFFFLAFYLLSGVLFPKKNVLAEYSDILDNRRNLDPRRPVEKVRPGERLVQRLLAFRGYQDPLQRRLEDVGWKMRTSEFALLHLLGVLAIAVVLLLLGAPMTGIVMIVLLLVAGPLLYLDFKAKKRRAAFEEQVPDTLLMLANSLRAGQGFEQGLAIVAAESPDPTAYEFKRLLAQQRLGISPEETLRTLADRMESESFEWAVLVTIIQRQVGGNLAEVYERIASTLRERDKLKREVKTLSAEGRMSAAVLVALPFVIGAGIALLSPEYISYLYTRTLGIVSVAGGLVLMGIGIVWIRSIIRFDF